MRSTDVISDVCSWLEQFSIACERNPGLHWQFVSLRSVIGLKKFTPPSQPIRCKTKTDRDLVTRVFQPLRPVTCMYFVFSLLAPCDIYLCSDRPLKLLQLGLVYMHDIRRHNLWALYIIGFLTIAKVS